jgi:hypothetical protein
MHIIRLINALDVSLVKKEFFNEYRNGVNLFLDEDRVYVDLTSMFEQRKFLDKNG